MKPNIIINDKYKLYNNKKIQVLLNRAVELIHINDSFEIELVVVDNSEIRKLNKKYRNLDEPTDVLSFVFNEQSNELNNKFIQPKQKKNKLGQIFISYDKVIEQSKDHQISIEKEAYFLFIHGLLHLLGLDHQDDIQEREMRKFEKQILN